MNIIDNLVQEGFVSNSPLNKNAVSESLREILARKIANIVWGKGYLFESNNEKIRKRFREICKENNLLNMFCYVERELSLQGRKIITINKTNGKGVRLSTNITNFYSGVGRLFYTEELAVCYQRIKIDQTNYIIKSTFDKWKVINEVYNSSENMLVLSEQVKILNEYNLKKIWRHNYGFVPVVEMVNIPYNFQWFISSGFEQLSDWSPAKIWEPVIYEAIINLVRELKINHSRILIQGGSQDTIQKAMKAQGDNPANVDIGDFIVETDYQATVTAVPGVGDFTKYTNAINDLMDLYFKFACMSRFSEGGGAQKSTSEANQTRSNEVETISQKIKLRENQINQLLRKLFAIEGLLDYDNEEQSEDKSFVFKIVGNIDMDESKLVDNVTKQVQLGTLSLVEAIQKIRGVDSQEADNIFKIIDKFNKEHNVLTNTSMEMGEDNSFDVGGNDGGAPVKDNE